MDDVALVAAVQGGDEEALADLFEECHAWTYSTCLNALRDPDAAEEATARVFEVAIRTRLAGAHALRPALIRLIHDACTEVDSERPRVKRGRRKSEQPPAAPDPTNLRLVAWRAAGDLSPADRILFALAAGMALSNESIALAVSPDKPASIAKRLDVIREHVVADVLAARSLDDCPDLRDTLRYSAKEPDAAARKKVHAHLAGRGRGAVKCAKCTKAYQRWPLAALAALLPLTAVPAGMSDRLLDRMELALRAGPDAGTGRKGSRTARVIDGATADVSTPHRSVSAPLPRTAPSDRSEPTAPPEPDPSPAAPTTPAGETTPPTPPTPTTPGARPGRLRPTTTVLAATVLVLGVTGVVALASHRSPATTTERLVADPAALPHPQEAGGALIPRPVPSLHAKSASPTNTPSAIEIPGARPATASPKASIRPVARSAPSATPDPFHAFGTLAITSPTDGSAVGFADADARLASVTLSVAVPEGFDAALLDSTLTWSGSYVLRKETQYVDLGSGQNLMVDLQAAARCTTDWTITATLTPPTGAPRYATTEVSISC